MSESTLGLDSWQLRLPSFEGPLDVLLTLIEREQLAISDLSLMAVTEGFLHHIDAMDDPPPALLADFLGVAARLLLLKSRALLPRPEIEETEEDLDDLAGQLLEYQRARQLAANLHEFQMSHWRSYSPAAPPPDRPTRVSFVLPPVATLGKAFLRALARQPVDPEQLVIRRVVTVAEMAARLHAAVLGRRGPRQFLDLVDQHDREEVVAGFIALLALWRRRQVEVSQSGLFGDIQVEACGPTERTPT